MFLQYQEQGHGFASMRAYAERLGGRLIVEPTGPARGVSVTGATVYLQKVSEMDQVLGMMKGAAAGEGRLPTEVVRRVFDRIRSGARSKDVNLTQREKEILVSVLPGHVLRCDRGGKGSQGGHGPERHLHHSGEAGRRLEAEDRGVDCAERAAG